MPRPVRLHPFLACACVALLSACGGGDASGTIGGSVTGLSTGQTVTLQDNNGDSLTIGANESFSFATPVDAGGTYEVSVLTQPVGETCAVANGSGTVDSEGDNVTDVTVTCSVTSSVGGTLSGLASGYSVWLSTNGEVLPLAANGAFAFPGVFTAGTTYDVTVSQQPAQQTCTVANPTGTTVSGVMASVIVTCQ